MSDAVEVRDARLADLPALTALYNHYIVTSVVTFDVEPFTVEERRSAWFEHYATTGPYRLLVATDVGTTAASDGNSDGHDNPHDNGDGETPGGILGYATSSAFRAKAAYRTSVETSVYCRPDAVGRGLGRLLYEQLFATLRDEDLHRAYAGIALPNEASLRLHARCGFTEVGTYHEVGYKDGRYRDVRWVERPLP